MTSFLTILMTLYLMLAIVYCGRRKPDYRHLRDTISELGETGAPDQRLVAYAVFLPAGLLALLIAGLLYESSQAASALAASIAAGYTGAAFFPCDPGSPLKGSAKQDMHNVAGALQYLGGGAALLSLAAQFGNIYHGFAIVVLGAAVGISVPPLTPVRGLIQRIAELCLFGGLFAVTIALRHIEMLP